jgi:UTP--glucose-1-phosphate uridylyltransferase
MHICEAHNTVEVTRAIITAAGKSQRTLPLQTLVDRDGVAKTALAIVLEEIFSAGIDEVCVVITPGDQAAFRAAAGTHANRLDFVEQPQPLGYGHAVHCAHEFVGERPFLLLVGDHLYISHETVSCAQQLVEVAASQNCSVSAVQATHESKLPFYGAVGGKLVAGAEHLYKIEDLIEKPTPTEAEQKLVVPGLRAGHYLCFFGMHVLTPAIMNLLGAQLNNAQGKPVHLTSALAQLAAAEKYLACELRGRRYDIGVKYGLLTAQMALALAGKDRDEVLTNLVELLAIRSQKR